MDYIDNEVRHDDPKNSVTMTMKKYNCPDDPKNSVQASPKHKSDKGKQEPHPNS